MNIATVEAIRAIHRNVVIGMSEKVISKTLSKILVRTGMKPYFNVVLFGSDAANPHGGVDQSRELEECEFILIDVGTTPTFNDITNDSFSVVGAIFLGYSSAITRTFLPKRTDIEKCYESPSLQDLWMTVYDAQTAAIESVTVNRTCADVDLAARRVIEDAGLGKYFTHRLGHGLGIEAHEPYSSPQV